jgi:hypothetical protein
MHTRQGLPLARWLASLAVLLTLGGCALPRMIDSEVQSFPGTATAVRDATYRFERLPSQQSDTASRDRVEAIAEQALTQAGLTRNDAQARYLVQTSLQIDTFARQPQRPPREHGMFGGLSVGVGSPSLFIVMEPPWYRYSVQLLLRERSSGQVAYETRAVFEGPWSDSTTLLPAIFEAALRDYPNPPTGPRKVVVELAPDGTLVR